MASWLISETVTSPGTDQPALMPFPFRFRDVGSISPVRESSIYDPENVNADGLPKSGQVTGVIVTNSESA